ncbi:fimbrial-like protein [Providencia alcalifaciens]|uniref:fimbrial-like protein n=1 Tax=Providencia alcalifaciens TaxID=126385 RepID=UPI002B05C2EB|nr:fimbrial-like protein [Providencia alcalifaciens]
MQIIVKKRNLFLTGILLLCLSIGGFTWSIYAFAINNASNTFTFAATFVGGSCQITAPPSVTFNNGNPLMPDDIKNGLDSAKHEFELTLSKCAGWGLTPSIHVNGTITTELGEPVFRDTGGESDVKGYGLWLSTIGSTDFEPNTNLARNGVIQASNWTPTQQLSTLATTIPIKAILTCGYCDLDERHGGVFTSTVTFDFLYE